MTARTAVAGLFDQIKGNPRLQIGLALIVAILAWFAHARLVDWAQAQSARHAEATAQLVRMEALVDETEWAGRAAAVAALKSQLEAELEPAETDGLAQAHLQAKAAGWLRSAGLTDQVRLQTSPPASTTLPGVRAVPLVLSGTLAPGSVLALVKDIESQRQLIVIDDLRYSPGPTGTMNLRLRAFYRIPVEASNAP